MMNEEAKLKEKVNKLIDRIDEYEKEILKQNSQIEELEKEIKILQVKENCAGAKAERVVNKESELFAVIKAFCTIVKMIIANEDYIKYSYETKLSGSFYKIEQSIFEDYICKYSEMDMKTFLDYCIDLALIKSETTRKCVYNSGNVRIYYLSRLFIERAIEQKDEQGV